MALCQLEIESIIKRIDDDPTKANKEEYGRLIR